MLLHARCLLTEQGWLDDYQSHIEEGIIAVVGPTPSGVMVRDTEPLRPVYTDTHAHGGAGADVMDETPNTLGKLAMRKAREGVVNWLPTTVTTPLPDIHEALERTVHRYHSGGPSAQALDSYLEGLYFTSQNRGAHPPELFRELGLNELDELIVISQQALRVVVLTPEKPGALQAIGHLKQRNARVMLGHNAATWERAHAAFDAGVDGLVHHYNGMTGLYHREPGTVGAGLTDPRAWLELTADGHHVYPAAVKLCCCCAKGRLVLITDTMQATGMPDERYMLCDEEVEMHSGIVHTASDGLTSSTFSIDTAVRNMVRPTGITAEETVHMASLHSTHLLGIDRQLGLLAVGKRTDAIALNSGLHLQQT